MTKLNRIWIERDLSETTKDTNIAIRIDWDNDRHQRIVIKDDTPSGVSMALEEAVALVNAERVQGKI